MTLSVAQAEETLKRHLEGVGAGAVGKGLLPRQVTICGGGNGAHVTAGYLGWKGVRVNVLTRRPRDWAKGIAISTQGSSWEEKGEFVGPLHKVSDDPAEVVPGSEYVIVAAPANAHPDLLAKVAPHLDFGAKVGALFAQGGFDWAVKQAFGPERCVGGCAVYAGGGVILFLRGGGIVYDNLTDHPTNHNRFARIGVMFGLQNIPWICKASKYGHAARYVRPHG